MPAESWLTKAEIRRPLGGGLPVVTLDLAGPMSDDRWCHWPDLGRPSGGFTSQGAHGILALVPLRVLAVNRARGTALAASRP